MVTPNRVFGRQSIPTPAGDQLSFLKLRNRGSQAWSCSHYAAGRDSGNVKVQQNPWSLGQWRSNRRASSCSRVFWQIRGYSDFQARYGCTQPSRLLSPNWTRSEPVDRDGASVVGRQIPAWRSGSRYGYEPARRLKTRADSQEVGNGKQSPPALPPWFRARHSPGGDHFLAAQKIFGVGSGAPAGGIYMIASLSNVENGISVGTRPRTYPEGDHPSAHQISRRIRHPGRRGDRRFYQTVQFTILGRILRTAI